MKILNIVTVFIFALTVGSGVSAHSDHDHGPKVEIDVKTLKMNALWHVKRLVGKKKLESSWEKAEMLTPEKKKFGKKMEWVVTFVNKKVADKAKQKLYIFFSLYGDYLAANFTGK